MKSKWRVVLSLTVATTQMLTLLGELYKSNRHMTKLTSRYLKNKRSLQHKQNPQD
jgi:hypothetical protein